MSATFESLAKFIFRHCAQDCVGAYVADSGTEYVKHSTFMAASVPDRTNYRLLTYHKVTAERALFMVKMMPTWDALHAILSSKSYAQLVRRCKYLYRYFIRAPPADAPPHFMNIVVPQVLTQQALVFALTQMERPADVANVEELIEDYIARA